VISETAPHSDHRAHSQSAHTLLAALRTHSQCTCNTQNTLQHSEYTHTLLCNAQNTLTLCFPTLRIHCNTQNTLTLCFATLRIHYSRMYFKWDTLRMHAAKSRIHTLNSSVHAKATIRIHCRYVYTLRTSSEMQKQYPECT
jgi:hypothetical protein